MPHPDDDPDEDLDLQADRDLPDPSDMDDDDQPDLIPCPHCRRMISEDAEQCHHCHMYITDDDLAPRKSAGAIVLIVFLVLLLAGIIGLILH